MKPTLLQNQNLDIQMTHFDIHAAEKQQDMQFERRTPKHN